MMNRYSAPVLRHAPWVAALLLAGVAIRQGARLPGYEHTWHPLGLLGARGLPGAIGFNLLGFVAPGLLAATVGWRLRARLPEGAPFAARTGAQALMLAALAFAAQGLFPLDPSDVDSPASGRHAATWTLWWLAFVVGGVLTTAGLRRQPAWSRIRRSTALATLAVPLLALLAPVLVPAGAAQRLAFAAWFAWAVATAFALSRSAASSRGS